MIRDVNDTEVTRAELKKWMKSRKFNGNLLRLSNEDYIEVHFKEDAEGMVGVEIETFFDRDLMFYENGATGFILYNDGITFAIITSMIDSAIKYMKDNMDKKVN